MDWGREECGNSQADKCGMSGPLLIALPLQPQESVPDPEASQEPSCAEVATEKEPVAIFPLSPVCLTVCFLSPAVLAANKSGS